MKNWTIEQWNISDVVAQIAGAKDVLHPEGIDANARWNLTNAAAAASIAPEELRARLNYRMRRLARQAQTEPVANEEAIVGA